VDWSNFTTKMTTSCRRNVRYSSSPVASALAVVALCVLSLLLLLPTQAEALGKGAGKPLFPPKPPKAWELPSHPVGAVVPNYKNMFNSAMPGVPRSTRGALVQTMGVRTEAESWLHRNLHPSVVPPQPKSPEPLVYRTVHAVVGPGLTAEAAGAVPVAGHKHMLMDIPDPSHPSHEPPSWRIFTQPDIPTPPLPPMAPQPPEPPKKAPNGDQGEQQPQKPTPKPPRRKRRCKRLAKGQNQQQQPEGDGSVRVSMAESELCVDDHAEAEETTSESQLAKLKMEILQQQKLHQQLLRHQAMEIERLRTYLTNPVGQAPGRMVSTYFSGARNPNAVYAFATQFPYSSVYPHETLPNLLPIMPDQTEAMHRANLADTVYRDSTVAARTLPFKIYRDMVGLHNTPDAFEPAVPGETQNKLPPIGWTEYGGKAFVGFQAATPQQAEDARNNYEKGVEEWYKRSQVAADVAAADARKEGKNVILLPENQAKKGKKNRKNRKNAEAASLVEVAASNPSMNTTEPVNQNQQPNQNASPAPGSTSALANAAADAANTKATKPPLQQAEEAAAKQDKKAQDKKTQDKKTQDKKAQDKTQGKPETKKEQKPGNDVNKSKKNPPNKKSPPPMREPPSELKEKPAKSFVEVSSDAETETEHEAEGETEAETETQSNAMDLEDMIAPTSQLPKEVAHSLLEAAHASRLAPYLAGHHNHGHATSASAKSAEQVLIRNSLRLMRMRSADEFDAQNGFSDAQEPSLAETAVMLRDQTLIPTTPSQRFGHGVPYGIPKPVAFRQAPFESANHDYSDDEVRASHSSLLALQDGKVRAVTPEETFLGSPKLTPADEEIRRTVPFELPAEWLKRPELSPLPEAVPPPELEL